MGGVGDPPSPSVGVSFSLAGVDIAVVCLHVLDVLSSFVLWHGAVVMFEDGSQSVPTSSGQAVSKDVL